MRVLPFGDAALLVEVDGQPEVLALTAAVRTARPAGVLDVVPAARTVLVAVVPGTDLAALRRAVLELPVGLAGEFSGVYPRPSPGGWQLDRGPAVGPGPRPARAARARRVVRFVEAGT